MIELTEQQAQALAKSAGPPYEVWNPLTKEIFLLVPIEEFALLTRESDNEGKGTR
ncbi:MAG TPA: hypothetical protein VGE52_17505 [Pirellulales bacterium]